MSPTLLAVGLDPSLIDTTPSSHLGLPGVDQNAVRAGADAAYEELRSIGFTIDRCAVDSGATAETTYRAALSERSYDYICIGAGVRLDPALSPLLDMLVNVSIELNPRATLVFDTGPAPRPTPFDAGSHDAPTRREPRRDDRDRSIVDRPGQNRSPYPDAGAGGGLTGRRICVR